MIDEKALEAGARAVLHWRIKPDFFEVKDGVWTLDHDKVIAEAAITAYLQALRPGSTGESDGWQPIETAPKDGTEILLYGPGVLLSDGRTSMYARAQHVGWAHEVDGHLEWATRDPSVTCRPTHWRPLPSPPSAMLAAAGGRDAE